MHEEKTKREFGSLRRRGRIWWLRYRIGGKEHWESLRTPSRKVAEKRFAQRAAEIGADMAGAPGARGVSFADLERMLLTHYRLEGLRSTRRVWTALFHLRAAFGSSRAMAITTDRVMVYKAARLDDGAARATVNYELACLRRAFNLAIEQERLRTAPAIRISDPKNARTGFFEADDFAAVLAALPAHLKPVMRFAYLTGWRVLSEVLPLTWDRVDFQAGEVRLEVNTTKTDEGRVFPFDVLPDLARLLRVQRRETLALQRRAGAVIPFVFHCRGGQRITTYDDAWRSACRAAAEERPHLFGRFVHDFRRTAVRNLVRAGVSEGVAMSLTGHKTRTIFERYNITSAADRRAAVAKLAAHLAAPGGQSGGNGAL